MACIEHAGDAVDVAEVKLVVLKLGTTRGEDNHIVGQLLGKLRVIVATAHTAIASAHHHKLANGTAFHGFYNLIGQCKHLIVGKTAYNLTRFNLRWGLAGLGNGNYFREILMPIGIFLDVFPTGETRRVHRKHAVFVVGFWRRRHDTVGGKYNRTIKCAELFFLFPPRVAVVSNQMLILFQFGIIVRGQHFAVGVHVNARSFGLFQ